MGAWHDLQILHRGMITAFTIREHGLVSVARDPPRLALPEAYGERMPLPDGLLDYLRAS